MTGPSPPAPFATGDVDTLVAAAAAAGAPLTADAATRLLGYLAAMLDENRAVNLTAIREPASALALHAVDSAAGLAALADAPREVLDLGTGNGFPGVAVAVRHPDARVTLVDRTAKKVAAIGRALERAGIANAAPLWLDAAQAPARRPELCGRFDLVVCRAVAEPREVGKLAKPLLRRGGHLLLWLAEDTPAPSDLPGALRRRLERTYRLPAPAERQRRVALYS